ncbi:hypothetical protein [Methylomonas koyamae]|uniref:Uncharacterized protein n=1 Tax=Methylomonas koyamae TaxID=702114 RepID=A0A291IF57_9GAMM|nr:hypothetical protein [Methylomonas koyamae]ATG88757.1 hypothetical protein MKLM6_0481 [Methylomonas koyamae]OAI26351.1 hypothetical protein A1356_11565 [Methylomonas koyamae]BBL56822.1 hypothetical protein MKFW12EY_04350 [Methylomonas koyamae]
MSSVNKFWGVLLLGLVSGAVQARAVDYCKAIRTFDDKDASAAPAIKYEDCSGVAFIDYAKYYVEARCWAGAYDLVPGKCDSVKTEAVAEPEPAEATPAEPAEAE